VFVSIVSYPQVGRPERTLRALGVADYREQDLFQVCCVRGLNPTQPKHEKPSQSHHVISTVVKAKSSSRRALTGRCSRRRRGTQSGVNCSGSAAALWRLSASVSRLRSAFTREHLSEISACRTDREQRPDEEVDAHRLVGSFHHRNAWLT